MFGDVNIKLVLSGVILFVIGAGMGIVPLLMEPAPDLPTPYLWWVGMFMALGLAILFFGFENTVCKIFAIICLAGFLTCLALGVIIPLLEILRPPAKLAQSNLIEILFL